MSGFSKAARIAILLLLLPACLMQLLAGYAGDKNWLLLAAKMWLQGSRLYTDIVEVNPPLVVWLYAIPSFISQHVPGLQDYQLLALLGLLSCAFCVALCAKLIRFHPAFAEDGRGRFEFVLLLAALLVFYTSPLYFFDREHIMLVFILPYLLRFMPGLAGATMPARLQILTGLMAALGFLIKPYALIPFAGVQLLYLVQRRSLQIGWSVENGIVYLGAAVYLACIYAFAPEYPHIIMPMALATYSAFSRRLFGFFYAILACIIAGVSFADFRPRFHSPFRRDIYYLAGICLSLLAYALVNNGWGYTYHPLICMILVTTFFLYKEYRWLEKNEGAKGLSVRNFIFGARASLINLGCNGLYAAGCMVVFFITPACDWSSDCTKNLPYQAYMKQHPAASFGALSEDFHKWPSLVRLTGATFETRYNALWMVPRLVREDASQRAAHQWIIESVALGLADDLNRRKPELMFVDTSPEFFGYPFAVDLPGFFSGIPEFQKAWSRYRYEHAIDGCKPAGRTEAPLLSGCRYAIYRRIGSQ